jgi:hypothetical protein
LVFLGQGCQRSRFQGGSESGSNSAASGQLSNAGNGGTYDGKVYLFGQFDTSNVCAPDSLGNALPNREIRIYSRYASGLSAELTRDNCTNLKIPQVVPMPEIQLGATFSDPILFQGEPFTPYGPSTCLIDDITGSVSIPDVTSCQSIVIYGNSSTVVNWIVYYYHHTQRKDPSGSYQPGLIDDGDGSYSIYYVHGNGQHLKLFNCAKIKFSQGEELIIP